MNNEFYIKVDFNKTENVNLKYIPLVKNLRKRENAYIVCGGLVKNDSITLIFKVNSIEELENFNENYENKFCKYELTTFSPRLLPAQ
ncbi:MAG: hypothetical protein FWC47_05530 [Oscillospiraceae bacterium]|nr:hypothetical protein [Oscillospiraceae bacterium]